MRLQNETFRCRGLVDSYSSVLLYGGQNMKILDLSAGNRAVWIQKDLDFVTFLDKRPETNPTFVCDTTNIPAAVGKNFDLIVFDPPHLNAGKNSNVSKSYGHHTTQEIKETIVGSARESWGVSKSNALMAFKWNDHDISLDTALELMSPFWSPLFGHHMRNRGGSEAKSQSFWVMLLRRDEPGQEINMKEVGRLNKRSRTTHKEDTSKEIAGKYCDDCKSFKVFCGCSGTLS